MLENWGLLFFIGELVVKLCFVGLVLLHRDRAASPASLTWIVVILAVPVVGLLAYLMVGTVRLGSWRLRKREELLQRLSSLVRPHDSPGRYPVLAPDYREIAMLATSAGATEPLSGNQLELHSGSSSFIERLVADVDAAKQHCHVLAYIYLDDTSGEQLAAALLRAVERGVDCRLLVDAAGSIQFLGSRLHSDLERGGVRVVAALPVSFVRAAFARLDLRNHRKLAVIDGLVGFTGSQNIADAAFSLKPGFAPWVDTMLRIEGPVVRDLQRLFIEDWYADTGEVLDGLMSISPEHRADGVPVQIVGTGPNYNTTALRQLNQAVLHTAREEVIMTTPYFVPDEATFAALCTAARRGVSTTVVLPARNDSPLVAAASRSFYEEMLDSGIELFEFTEGLLHAKTLTADRKLAFVSTANFDRRSFELNYEISTLVYDTDFASQLRFLQRDYVSRSRRVELLSWRQRPWPRRLVQNAAGMLSAIL